MKHFLQMLCVALFFISCQKTLTTETDVTTATLASNANSPLKSHTLTFTSNYPVKAGEVPPFSFTKTVYPDHRVKTIRMLSRKNPIYPGFAKQALELIGTFTYAANPNSPPPDDPAALPHLAFLKGTMETWDYYKAANGSAAKRSLGKKVVNWKFYFNDQGICLSVEDINPPLPEGVKTTFQWTPDYAWINDIYDDAGHFSVRKFGFINSDQYSNITGFTNGYEGAITHPGESNFTITYDYSAPAGSKNYSYIPTQNLICPEFSLMEVMQWVPKATYQRKTASGKFMLPNGTIVTQSQVYKNYKFDANGNQTSLTYGDNVIQKTTWDVQP
jgi:hypothetical protein